MIFKCLRNFSCNKVNGVPGKVLSEQEVLVIGDFLPSLLHNELVLKIEEKKEVASEKEVKELEPEKDNKKKNKKKSE